MAPSSFWIILGVLGRSGVVSGITCLHNIDTDIVFDTRDWTDLHPAGRIILS